MKKTGTMEKTISPHRNKIVSIVISIILHLCILIFIFVHRYARFDSEKSESQANRPEAEVVILPEKQEEWATRYAPLNPIHQEEQKEQEQEEWATRQTQLNPALIHNPISETINTTQETLDNTENLDNAENLNITPKTLSSNQESTDLNDRLAHETETPVQTNMFPHPTKTIAQTPTKVDTTETVQAAETAQEKAPITKILNSVPAMQKPLMPTTPTKEQKIAAQKELQAKKMQAVRADLAKLAKTFMGYGCDQTGDSRLSIRGNHDGPPTAEQLKQERYMERISGCILQSMRMLNKEYPYESQDFPTNPRIMLTIGANGFPQSIQLVTSSKDRRIDAFFIHVFKDAGNSFPPIPSYLNKKSLTMSYEIVPTPSNSHSSRQFLPRRR